jgi:hypothetical protein
MSNVRDFGASGDGQTDDTDAILHAMADGDGLLEFSRGVYRITRTIEIPLTDRGPTGIVGSAGTARVVMAGPGPAFRLVGTHEGSGDPASVKPHVSTRERLPSVLNIEIEGAHAEADGLELIGTMQSVLEGLLVTKCRHGIRLHKRNRNVLITHCHVYHNTGVGVFLDQVNLHQINIIGCHISYNRLGGIRIAGSEVRNLQITGNDIEYNNHRSHDKDPEPTAEIWIDTAAERSSVEEVTVASNTIQATPSPGGANLRIVQNPDSDRAPGLWTISGNIIGNQENSVHLTGCHGIVLSGNFIYSSEKWNLLVEDSRQINITGNSFRRHTERLGTGVRIAGSSDCVLSGCTIQDEAPEGQASGQPLLEIADCRRITVNGCQLLDGVPYGVHVIDSSQVCITGSTIMDTRAELKSRGAIRFSGRGVANLVMANIIGPTREKPLEIDEKSIVTVGKNVEAT